MVSLLKVIDNPLQDIPLVAVLGSGLVDLDEIALAHIRKSSKIQVIMRLFASLFQILNFKKSIIMILSTISALKSV